MNKMILIAACAAALFCTTGCSKENEYEKCLRESMKNMPELISKPAIEKAVADDPEVNVLIRGDIGAGYGDNAFLSLFLGVMTGVGGGVLRDMLVGDIPTILVRRIYAIAAAAGAALYYALHRLGASETAALLSGVGVTLTLRLLSMIFHWNLPRVRMPKEERDEDASKQTEADCGRPKRKTDHGL